MKFLLSVIAAHLCLAEAANILYFFPMPLRSHHSIFEPLVRELAARGHQVTAVTPFQMKDPPPNYEEILVENILMELIESINITTHYETSLSVWGVIKTIIETNEWGVYLQSRICSMKKVQDLIHSKRTFDVYISENLMQESFSAFQHKFGAPGVELIPFPSYSVTRHFVGAGLNPSYIPDAYSPYTNDMSFIQRVDNSLTTLAVLSFTYYYLPKLQKITDSCFNYTGWETRPPLKHLLSDKAIVLENSHFSLGTTYPLPPNVIQIAGLNIKQRQPLPKDMQKFMDEASQGVILFSFGSLVNISELSQQKIDAFLDSFAKLQERVLFKWEAESVPRKLDNVMFSKWLPQQDILAHKNCRLFITHGGISSITEAINYGIPLIGIPFFGEQLKNVNSAVSLGVGLHLEWENITEPSLTWAINEVLQNQSYLSKAKERSILFKDRSVEPLESAVYWVEYVIRHKGAQHLRPGSIKLFWWQTALLDVILILFGPIVIISYLTLKLAVRVVRQQLKGEKPKPKPKKTKRKAE